MAETARQRPALVPARQQLIEMVGTAPGNFDPDFLHCMEERDNELIRDQIVHGAGSSTFVYSFEIQGKLVSGISVIGAQHAAHHYGGLQHRMVASTQKSGRIFTFTSYPSEFGQMTVTTAILGELETEEDFYSAVCEVKDIKTGNTVQIERREQRWEERRHGGWFERPNFTTIAQSKARRNAILAILPQDVLIEWKIEQLKLNKDEILTANVIEEKRANILRFAAERAVGLDRRAIEHLSMAEMTGLGDAARAGLCRNLSRRPKPSGSISRSARRSRPSRASNSKPRGARPDGRRRRPNSGRVRVRTQIGRDCNKPRGERNPPAPKRNPATRALARRNKRARRADQVRNRRAVIPGPQTRRQKVTSPPIRAVLRRRRPVGG